MPSPGRLNDSNASPRGERQPARGLPHGDSCGVNNKLQQQVDEYLASFDPEKPLYHDGWAMGDMQENF